MTEEREETAETDPGETSKRNDPECILKGVQAFGVGVALFAASVALAHVTIGQMDSKMPVAIQLPLMVVLLVMNVAVSTFGCIGVLLGLSMTGFVKTNQRIDVVTLGSCATWFVIAFVIASSI